MKHKKIIILLSKTTLWSMLFAVALLTLVICASAATTVSTVATGQTNFFIDNWEVICLVISELAALLPGTYSGIIQTLLKILKPLFLAILKKKED